MNNIGEFIPLIPKTFERFESDKVRAEEQLVQIHIQKVPQALLRLDALGNMHLPVIDDGYALVVKGDDLAVDDKNARSPLTIADFKEIVIVQGGRRFGGVVGEQIPLRRDRMFYAKFHSVEKL